MAARWARFCGAIATAARWLAAEIDAEDCVLAIGLVLVGVGIGMVCVPAGLAVPGAVLVYVALRSRGGRGEGDQWASSPD